MLCIYISLCSNSAAECAMPYMYIVYNIQHLPRDRRSHLFENASDFRPVKIKSLFYFLFFFSPCTPSTFNSLEYQALNHLTFLLQQDHHLHHFDTSVTFFQLI